MGEDEPEPDAVYYFRKAAGGLQDEMTGPVYYLEALRGGCCGWPRVWLRRRTRRARLGLLGDSMFEQSKLKIKRANHHIDELKGYITEVLKDRLYTLSIEKNPQTQKAGLVCRMCSNETDIPLIMGDVAHNLRSAIDILYCDILRHEGRTVDKHSKWPFRETREGLIGALNGRQPQDALRDAVVDLIVDSLQTYRGGRGDDLYALHDLNIEDKHMLLLPTININNVQGVEFVGADGTVGTFGGSSFGGDFSGTGAHSRIEAATDIVEIVNFGSAALDLRFGTKTFHGQPVVPTLHRISRLVSTTVETVEKCLNPA